MQLIYESFVDLHSKIHFHLFQNAPVKVLHHQYIRNALEIGLGNLADLILYCIYFIDDLAQS